MTTSRPGLLTGLLITLLLHLVILGLAMSRRTVIESRGVQPDAIQWLLPLAPKVVAPLPRARAPEPPRVAATANQPRSMEAAPIVPPIVAPPPPPETASAPPATWADPFALPAPAQPATARDILQQAKLDVGKIDKELRKAYPERMLLPPRDSKQARLERGFNAAHEAVPPKWYEGARIIELNTASGVNQTRSYKIVTGLGTYCINVYPDGKKTYTTCPA